MAVAPALSTTVQELAQLGFRAGLVPYIEEPDDDGTVTVALLPSDHAHPERDAEWLLTVEPNGKFTLFGPPAADDEDAEARHWHGYQEIHTTLSELILLARITPETS